MSNVNCYFHSEIQTMVNMQNFKKQYLKWNPLTKLGNGLTVTMYSKCPNDRWCHDTCQIDSLFELMNIKVDNQPLIRGISPCTLETLDTLFVSSPPPGRGCLVEPAFPNNDKSNKKLKKLWNIFRKSAKEYYLFHDPSASTTEPQVIAAYKAPDVALVQTSRFATHYIQPKARRHQRTSHYRNKLREEISINNTC